MDGVPRPAGARAPLFFALAALVACWTPISAPFGLLVGLAATLLAVRAMRRSGGGIVEAASVPRQHRAALAAVSHTVHTVKEGEFASARQGQAERLAQRPALGHRRGLRP